MPVADGRINGRICFEIPWEKGLQSMALEVKGRNQRELGKKMRIFPLSDIASEFSSSTESRASRGNRLKSLQKTGWLVLFSDKVSEQVIEGR